jgi:hypothetical protein
MENPSRRSFFFEAFERIVRTIPPPAGPSGFDRVVFYWVGVGVGVVEGDRRVIDVVDQ